MKIGCCPFKFINKDIQYNLSQIEKAFQLADSQTDLLCFGESFVQGFDGLRFDYSLDQYMAISKDSEQMEFLKGLTISYGIDLLIGYIENDEGLLYSSYALIENGEIIKNYRRISPGWKESYCTDERYQQGNDTEVFLYKGKKCKIALCGDLWVSPSRFMDCELLFWPIYVSFTLKQWRNEELEEYQKQASNCCNDVLLINSISQNPDAIGGAFYFHNGTIAKCVNFNEERIMYALI